MPFNDDNAYLVVGTEDRNVIQQVMTELKLNYQQQNEGGLLWEFPEQGRTGEYNLQFVGDGETVYYMGVFPKKLLTKGWSLDMVVDDLIFYLKDRFSVEIPDGSMDLFWGETGL